MAYDGHFAELNDLEYPSARMIRVMQLIDAGAGYQAERGAAALARELGSGFAVRTQMISARGGLAGIATAGNRLRRQEFQADVIHAWGGRALAVAALRGGRIVYTPADSPARASVGWLRAVMG